MPTLASQARQEASEGGNRIEGKETITVFAIRTWIRRRLRLSLFPVNHSHRRMNTSMVKAPCGPRPFTASVVCPSTRRACVASATRGGADARTRRAQPSLRTRSAEPAQAEPVELLVEEEEQRGPRRSYGQDQPQFKHFLPLPKPAHLVYIKPTVAVVAGMASRSSVGVKMTAGDNRLERYVIEFYSKSVK